MSKMDKTEKRKDRNTNQNVALALGLAMLLGITGCAEKETEPAQKDISAQDSAGEDAENDDASKDSEGGEEGSDALQADDGTQEAASKDEAADSGAADAQDGGDAADASEQTERGAEESGGQTIDFTEGAEHLGGKIQSLSADGMTFAHTTLMDEDNSVTLLDVEDAEKIEVKFTADTKVEHWIIQGGGAGIDMQDAAFLDLKEGMGVELEGNYDGDTFVAAKVIIEDYE